MLVDSHCHLDFPDLAKRMPDVLQRMRDNDVGVAVCIGVNLEDFPNVLALAEGYSQLYATVGVHPEYTDVDEPDEAKLLRWRNTPRSLQSVRPGSTIIGRKISPSGSVSDSGRISGQHDAAASRWWCIPGILLQIRCAY